MSVVSDVSSHFSEKTFSEGINDQKLRKIRDLSENAEFFSENVPQSDLQCECWNQVLDLYKLTTCTVLYNNQQIVSKLVFDEVMQVWMRSC